MQPHTPDGMTPLTRRHVLQGALAGAAGVSTWLHGWPRLQTASAQHGGPSGQMTWAAHITIAPLWLDPAETLPVITPYMLLYAVHDALLKPMPGNAMAPSLATEWRESPDALSYDFTLRQGVKFHNGDPFSAEDVQFSFERYRGTGAALLKSKVKQVEMVNPHHVRFHLHEPWPDFMTFYGTPVTGAGWIVPKQYTLQIGDKEFKNQPVGLGPYRMMSHQAGIEVVLEAYPEYWRKTPSVKRLVIKSVPEPTTRLAMLKSQEADIVYVLLGSLAEEVRRDARLKLAPVVPPTNQWLTFIDQYDPKSPWSVQRVRLAANHAVNLPALNEAETLGYSVIISSIVPSKFDYALLCEPYGYDPAKARQLLKEAGYPNGFDAGECSTDSAFASVVESLANDLGAIGIRVTTRPMERAAVQAAQIEKTVRNLTRQGSGAFGTAASRLEAFVHSKGTASFLKDPELDAWFAQQAIERDRTRRQALLHQMQRKLYDEARFLPIWELTALHATGPRVAVSGLGLIPLFAFSGPYEDVQLNG